jgi:hypothetical protein
MAAPAPDTRQHQVVADLKEILELGLVAFNQRKGGTIDYSFEVFDNEDGTKFIGVTIDGHTEDQDELSEWSLQPERA